MGHDFSQLLVLKKSFLIDEIWRKKHILDKYSGSFTYFQNETKNARLEFLNSSVNGIHCLDYSLDLDDTKTIGSVLILLHVTDK